MKDFQTIGAAAVNSM